MKIRRRKRERHDITVIPMIDVFIVLLIFFMITTTFNKPSSLNIKLPETQNSQTENNVDDVTLSIDEKGTYYLADVDGVTKKLPDQNRETLTRELNKLSSKAKEMPFIIRADSKSYTQAVMTALDVAGQLGFNHISFATLNDSSHEN